MECKKMLCQLHITANHMIANHTQGHGVWWYNHFQNNDVNACADYVRGKGLVCTTCSKLQHDCRNTVLSYKKLQWLKLLALKSEYIKWFNLFIKGVGRRIYLSCWTDLQSGFLAGKQMASKKLLTFIVTLVSFPRTGNWTHLRFIFPSSCLFYFLHF